MRAGWLFVFAVIAILLAGCTQPDDASAKATPSPESPKITPSAAPNTPTATPEQAGQPLPSPTSVAGASPAPVIGEPPTPQPTATPAPETLKLEDYDGKFFTIKKPVGWEITTGGACSTFSFIIKDKARPQRQVFYFGEIGPVYLDESQKALDKQYMDMGGRILWYEMPVVKPLTPENFLKTGYALMQTSLLGKFMTDLPELNEVEMISSSPAKSPVAGDTKLMRALFKTRGGLGEGQFFLTTAPVIPLTGYASGGFGYGFTFVGISAEKSEFKNLEKTLSESINSFTILQEYINACINGQNAAAAGALKAQKTLSETSDILMSGWENRNKVDDILSEKRSDAMLGTDRVYNPDTGEVYDVANGFYDDYDINRQKFQLSNLQQLPDNDWDLWTAPTEDGSKIR
ncbi:MAG: hypothetical protein V1708_00990 [Candidatus Micrarchaeota archaeon]